MQSSDPNLSHKSILSLLIIFTGIIILRNAWVGDDSYIGFRTVYNFTHGYGLTFNINERVQSFTNPLWILLMSFFYLFTGEAYFTSIFLSLTLTLLSLYLICKKLHGNLLPAILVFALACSSKAFIDYSTSGLENPLSYFFIVVFFTTYLDGKNSDRKTFLLFFIASLAAVNRLDNFLLYLFPLITRIKFKSRKSLLLILGGLSPLILWEAFSILYYGFIFPNTYYTKLNTGISFSEYAMQGIRYLINSLDLDAITLFVIASAVTGGIYHSFRKGKNKLIPLVGSIILYLLYTIKVGGDFMSGRFLTYEFLISIILLTQIELDHYSLIAFLSITILFTLVSPYSPVKSNSVYRRHELTFSEIVVNEGVADERAWYFPNTGLINLRDRFFIEKVESDLDSIPHRDSIVSFITEPEVLGFMSYSLGPDAYIFHGMGLTDPLIARLPRDEDADPWRIGHIERKIPEGYVETLHSGINQMTDKNLAEFYDKLSIIIRGKIFSWERFKTIYKMNTGQYDYLINKRYYASVRYR